MKCNKIRHLYLLFYIYYVDSMEVIILISVATALFALGMGLGAWLENVRLTSYWAEKALMERITQEFEVQNKHIWAAAKIHKKQCPSSEEEGHWDVRITQELPEITGEYRLE